jgi:hypothetical protein
MKRIEGIRNERDDRLLSQGFDRDGRDGKLTDNIPPYPFYPLHPC